MELSKQVDIIRCRRIDSHLHLLQQVLQGCEASRAKLLEEAAIALQQTLISRTTPRTQALALVARVRAIPGRPRVVIQPLGSGDATFTPVAGSGTTTYFGHGFPGRPESTSPRQEETPPAGETGGKGLLSGRSGKNRGCLGGLPLFRSVL